MKYTRLDLRKRRSNFKRFLPLISFLLVISFLLGTLIFNTFFKSADLLNIKNTNQEANTDSENTNNTKLNSSFIFIQGGIFGKVENANACKAVLINYGNVFTVNSNNTTRVLIGIYNEKDGLSLLQKINGNKVEAGKVEIKVNTNSISRTEICEIVNAEIQLINRLDDKDVKAINTSDFKKWTASLKAIDKSDKDYLIVEEMKNNIKNLPTEISKDKIGDMCVFLYQELEKINKK